MHILSFQWEIDFIKSLQSVGSDALTSVMTAFSLLGEELALVLVVGLMYWCLNKRTGRRLALGMIAGLLGGEIIKSSVRRLRPYFSLPEVACLRAPSGSGDILDLAAQGYSFPSMHASNSVIMFGLLAAGTTRRTARSLCLAMPLVIGFSRVYLGVHYPTDVLAGWLFGLIVLLAVMAITRRTENYLLICLSLAILALPGWFICKTDDFGASYGLMIGMLLGFAFESKYVKFENTHNPLRVIVRLIAGMAIFLALGEMLKMILPPGQIIRSARYCVVSFIVMGIYPMIFNPMNKIWKCAK